MCRTVLISIILLLCVSVMAAGEHVSIVPTHATGSYSIDGNEITLQGGGQHVFLELFMSDWDPDLDGTPALSGYSVRVDPASFTSGSQGKMWGAQAGCLTQSDCDAIWGIFGPVCGWFSGFPQRGSSDFCDGSFVAPFARPDHLFFGGTFGSCEAQGSEYTCTVAGPPYAVDTGAAKYIGTLTLQVSGDAIGTFTFDLLPHDGGYPGGYLVDELGNLLVPLLDVTPALITVQPGAPGAGNDCAAAIDPGDPGYNPVCSTPGELVCTVASATNIGADLDGPAAVRNEWGGDAPVLADVWYPYLAACSGTLVVSTCDLLFSTLDIVVAIYHDAASPLTCVCPAPDWTGRALEKAGADENCNGIADAGPAFVTQTVAAGECYTIRVAGYDFNSPDLWHAHGEYSLDVSCFPGEAASLPAGADVGTAINGGSETTGGVDLTFSSIDAPGDFSADYMVLEDGDIMIGEAEFLLPGDPAQAWNVTFTGEFSGTVEITFAYDPALLTVPEAELRVYHRVGGVWTDLPVVSRDAAAHTITVTTTSFSLFALGVSLNGPCPVAAPPAPEAVAVARNRYLSFADANPGTRVALRVTMLNLPAPYDTLNNASMWVGASRQVSELGGVDDATPPTFTAAPLQCDPVYDDWNAKGLVYVYGEAIVPGGSYKIQAIHESAACNTASEADFSTALVLDSGRWGDVVGPFDSGAGTWANADGSVDVATDVVAVLDKFGSLPGSPAKARADLEPETPDQKINITDVTVILDAFGGTAYPFAPPAPPCP